MTTWVYFIQVAPRGPIKIGVSRDIETRLASLQSASPYQLRLLGSISGDASHERLLHAQFAHLRMKGEWFRPRSELLRFVDAIVDRKASDVDSLRRAVAGAQHDALAPLRKGTLPEDELVDQLDTKRLFKN